MNMLFSMNFILIMISFLISVAFYTILERKLLSYSQMRKGPNKVGFMGILQPFSDAIKLFNKSLISSESMNFSFSYLSPPLSLFMPILIIPIISFNQYPLFDNIHNLLMFFILSSMSVYFILLIGWSTNSKYSYMGAIRSVAQMISYEVSFFMIILFLMIISKSYSFIKMSETQVIMPLISGNVMLFLLWMSSCLAETNRSPYDFAEGESELVSGFNVEYMGGWFALIFLAEYLSMIILSMITSILFFKNISSFWIISSMLIAITLIWIRATMPRFRYDLLMTMSWKIFLPLSLFMIILPFSFSSFSY